MKQRWAFSCLHGQRRSLVSAFALAAIVLAVDGSAAVLPVASCEDDGGSGTLRSTIAMAASGDTVDLGALECATITLTGGQIEVSADDLFIEGPGRDALVITAAGTSRVFSHNGSGTLELQGVTISDGLVVGSHGGCISAEYGSVTLIDSTVTSCTAKGSIGQSFKPWGGAIFAVGDITLVRSKATDNTVTSDIASSLLGGALATWRIGEDTGDITLIDSVVSDNKVVSTDTAKGNAEGGGVATVSSGTVTIVRSRLTGNSVYSASTDPGFTSLTAGGAVSAFNLYVEQSTISGNIVVSANSRPNTLGGGIVVTGAADIIDSAIINNSCNVLAGGLGHSGAILGLSRLNIVNSTFANNFAKVAVGAILVGAPTTIRNSTIAHNSAPGAQTPIAPSVGGPPPPPPPPPVTPLSGIGGILFSPVNPSATLEIESSIIAANVVKGESPYGDDLAAYVFEPITVIGSDDFAAQAFEPITVVGSHNLIGDTTDVILPGDTLTGDPQLSPLADNGGATSTLALATTSPAIDAGSNDGGLVFDQRGSYFLRTSGLATDIGAFENQPMPDLIFIGSFDG